MKKFFNINTFSVVCTLFAFSVISYYIIFPSRGEFHADCTDTLMWAQASYESCSVFNSDFGYACLLAFGGHWIMVPLISLFGVSVKTHITGMFIFFVIFSVSLFAMLKAMKIPSSWSLISLSVTLLVLSGSEKLREIFWGHIIYYSLGMFYSFVGLMLIFKIIDTIEQENKKFILFSVLLFIWCILAGTNQLEILTLFLIPAFCAVAGERFFSFEKYKSKKEISQNIILTAVIATGSIGGYLIGELLTGNITAGYAEGHSTLSASSTWSEHISLILPYLVRLLGAENLEGIPLISARGIQMLVVIITSLALIITPVIITLLYPKIKNRRIRVFIIFHWIMTALIMLGFICGQLSSANWRLSPIVCSSVIMNLILAYWIFSETDRKRFGLLAIVPVVSVSLFTSGDILTMPPDYNMDSRIYRISEYLEENNLDYGYATFWNANVITVLTDSEIKVRSIEIEEDGTYIPNYYQSNKKWFEDQPEQENYFLLLEDAEYNLMVENNILILSIPHEERYVEGYMLLVYEKNLF